MQINQVEYDKYTELWRDFPEYRDYSPGMENVQRFLDVMPLIKRGQSLIDVGCGTGVAGLEFANHGLLVNWIDITDAGLLPAVPRKSFTKAELWAPWHRLNKYGYDYGFCCDVMEHIPPEYTMLVIDRILAACRTVWFQIALTPDRFGAAIGQPLHLTVKPFTWWRDRLASLGNVIEARDLCGVAMFVVKP